MPTARICLRHNRWYYLFVFYSLMTYTETFYLMDRTTTSNAFATYEVSKKKDYKAELLQELAADEDLYFATSTIHFLKRLKTMKCKYVTDGDSDETTIENTVLTEFTAGSKIQNRSNSLKNKTLKTFESLWNMMRTFSDDSWSKDESDDSKNPTTEFYEEDYDFKYTKKTKNYKYLTKATTQPKVKASKRYNKKKKVKSSNHKKRKGYKSNSTENNSNIVNISVRRLLNTPACKCHTKTSVKKGALLSGPGCRDKRKEILLTKGMRPRVKHRQQCYKVNNTILLNLNNNADCACKRRMKIKCFKECTTEQKICKIPMTVTDCPTTQLPKTTTELPKITTRLPKITTICSITTTIKNVTTESEECPDIFTCETARINNPMQCCLCSNNLMKELRKMNETKLLLATKCTRKRKYKRPDFKSSTDYAFETTSFNENKSRTTCLENNLTQAKSTVFDDVFKKTWRVPKWRRKRTTFEFMRKIITSLPPSTFKNSLTSNLCFRMRKRCSLSTSSDRNDRAKCSRRKCTTLRAKCSRRKCTTLRTKNNTATSFQIRPSLSEDPDGYEDDVKETEYYEEYYDGYDESATTSNPVTNEELDVRDQDIQASPHNDLDGSTIFPEDDPALSAYNFLNIFPFNHGRSSTVDSENGENICNKDASDLVPNNLESIARKIYRAALKVKNDLDENRSERTFMERKKTLVKHSMENLNRIQKRCNYLLREIKFSRKGYIKKLQQLLGLSKVRDQVEKRIKGKLHQILDDIKHRNSN